MLIRTLNHCIGLISKYINNSKRKKLIHKNVRHGDSLGINPGPIPVCIIVCNFGYLSSFCKPIFASKQATDFTKTKTKLLISTNTKIEIESGGWVLEEGVGRLCVQELEKIMAAKELSPLFLNMPKKF